MGINIMFNATINTAIKCDVSIAVLNNLWCTITYITVNIC